MSEKLRDLDGKKEDVGDHVKCNRCHTIIIKKTSLSTQLAGDQGVK